jgi:YesN/AraC family two-component response regulator
MYIPPALGAGGRRVLFVDDDGHVLAGMRQAMKTYSSQVELLTAQSGIEALVMVGSKQPEVVVLDVNMCHARQRPTSAA